jgi:hypothetical protein
MMHGLTNPKRHTLLYRNTETLSNESPLNKILITLIITIIINKFDKATCIDFNVKLRFPLLISFNTVVRSIF